MVDTNDTAEFERKKKLFTILPLFILPVLTLLFWALGGGESNAADMDGGRGPATIVNTDLPAAIVDKEESKRELYRQVRQEKDRRAYALSRDPYADQLRDQTGATAPASGIDDWEQRFNERTGNLQRELDSFNSDVSTSAGVPSTSSQPTTASAQRSPPNDRSQLRPTSRSSMSQGLDLAEEDEQVRQIERAIAELNNGSDVGGGSTAYGASFAPVGGELPFNIDDAATANPMTAQDSVAFEQVAALDRIMERAVYLQHPELLEEELRKRSEENGKILYPVGEAPSTAGDIKIFGAAPSRADTVTPPTTRRQTGFFTDDSDEQSTGFEQLTVRAQVHNSAVVMDGSTVKMRLLEDVYVAGQRVPANTFVYGVAGLRGDRLSVTVSTIAYRNNVYDVGLSAYDLDGQPGLAVPGSVERQIAKREAARTARGLGGQASGRNLTAQLAADGAQTIKEITSRKLSVIKVELKAGHQLILRNQ